jgi:hypothetical protein
VKAGILPLNRVAGRLKSSYLLTGYANYSPVFIMGLFLRFRSVAAAMGGFVYVIEAFRLASGPLLAMLEVGLFLHFCFPPALVVSSLVSRATV